MQQSKTIEPSRKSYWWWIYFTFSLVVSVASLFVGKHTVLDAFLDIYYGIGLIGLWGYLTTQPIGWRTFWVVYFALMAAGFIYTTAIILFVAQSDPVFVLGLSGAVFALSVPQWVAIWRYAFKSAGLWGDSSAA